MDGIFLRDLAALHPPLVQTMLLYHPSFEYGRNKGGSITGGYVYRGSKIPEYAGKYIYGDFVSGRIWALTPQNNTSIEHIEIANTNLGISSFGVDSNNELYICAFDGLIYTLNRPE